MSNLSKAIIIGIAMMTSVYATANNGTERVVNHVRWQKEAKVDINQLLNRNVPVNSANVIFLRPKDGDTVQMSANISINDRFQVSLQPGNYSQVYSCVGVNQISAQITGFKNNDLLNNVTTFKLEPNVTYFFYVDVENNGSTKVRHITKESAMQLLYNMNYQTHQISRVVPNCPIPAEPEVPPPYVPETPQYEPIELLILFDNDKAIVKKQYHNEIKRVADFMNRYPEVTVTLEGHTDSNAPDAYNVGLSQRRVDATKKILINQYGIDASRVNSVGYGESRPVATNATAEGRQKNRRVIAVFENNLLR